MKQMSHFYEKYARRTHVYTTFCILNMLENIVFHNRTHLQYITRTCTFSVSIAYVAYFILYFKFLFLDSIPYINNSIDTTSPQ